MPTIYSSRKCCANCVYWCGNREISKIGTKVENNSSLGKCGSPKGGYKNKERKAESMACSIFEKLPMLK